MAWEYIREELTVVSGKIKPAHQYIKPQREIDRIVDSQRDK